MAAWLTAALLKERYPGIEDLADDAQLTEYLTAAQAEAESYVAIRYALPLEPVPSLLIELVAQIARYRAYPEAPEPHIRQVYEDAVRRLREIAAGTAALPQGAESSPEDLSTSDEVLLETEPRWTRQPGPF